MWKVNNVVVNDGDVYVAIERCGDMWEANNVIDGKRMDWDVSFNVLLERCRKCGWFVTNL